MMDFFLSFWSFLHNMMNLLFFILLLFFLVITFFFLNLFIWKIVPVLFCFVLCVEPLFSLRCANKRFLEFVSFFWVWLFFSKKMLTNFSEIVLWYFCFYLLQRLKKKHFVDFQTSVRFFGETSGGGGLFPNWHKRLGSAIVPKCYHNK